MQIRDWKHDGASLRARFVELEADRPAAVVHVVEAIGRDDDTYVFADLNDAVRFKLALSCVSHRAARLSEGRSICDLTATEALIDRS